MRDIAAVKDAEHRQALEALWGRCVPVKLLDKRDEEFRTEFRVELLKIAAEHRFKIDIEKLAKETNFSIRAAVRVLEKEINRVKYEGKFKEDGEETDGITLYSLYKDIIKNAGAAGMSAKEIAAVLKKNGEIHRIKSGNANKAITSALTRYVSYYGKKCGIKKANRRYYAV